MALGPLYIHKEGVGTGEGGQATETSTILVDRIAHVLTKLTENLLEFLKAGFTNSMIELSRAFANISSRIKIIMIVLFCVTL